MQRILASTIAAIGGLLMIGKIYADSEPGAIPLALAAIGGGWYLSLRFFGRRNEGTTAVGD